MIQNNNQEIDILALIIRLWNKRFFILSVTCAFVVVGIFIAIFSDKVYTSSCTFVPQTSKKSSSGSISSIAALAGINLGDMTSGETLSPVIYPQILNNIDFRKELMYSKIKIEKFEEPISIIDYFTNPEYMETSIMDVVAKYTIGLPGIIMRQFSGEKKEKTIANDNLKSYSKNEYQCSLALSKCISMSMDEKKGYIVIAGNMSEPLAAAQLCQTTFDLLQKYVTKFKISKVQNQLDFIQKRYEDSKLRYEKKQEALAHFIDANQLLSTAQARMEQERLTAEYNLASTMYTEMAKQRLQAEIQVKEDTPILTAINPVIIPTIKSKPKKMQILVLWGVIGAVLGAGAVLAADWITQQGYENKWLTYVTKS